VDAETETIQNNGNPANNSQPASHLDMPVMNHSTSGQFPKGLREAKNPTFKVGSQAFIKADHMPGMKGAKAIVGAYDTTAYAVSYHQLQVAQK
jgi:hypothetical protein